MTFKVLNSGLYQGDIKLTPRLVAIIRQAKNSEGHSGRRKRGAARGIQLWKTYKSGNGGYIVYYTIDRSIGKSLFCEETKIKLTSNYLMSLTHG